MRPSLTRGWTGAVDLRVGERLEGDGGHALTVTANADDKRPEGVGVYNFTVDQDHTYFVAGPGAGRDYVWVHNQCTTPEGQAIVDQANNGGLGSLRTAGNQGTDPTIRELPGTASDARNIFDGLTAGGSFHKPLPGGGEIRQMPGGVYVTFRPAGTFPNRASGVAPPTIEINIPGSDRLKLKLL